MKSEKFIGLTLAVLILSNCGPLEENLTLTDRAKESPMKKPDLICPGGKPENTDGFGGGDGTQDNPYLICTVEQFKNIHGVTTEKRYFRLTSDIDFSAEENLKIVALSPMASIDGNDHTIRNITIKHGYGFKDNGLFGQLTKDSNGNRDEIKNLIIENVTVLGDGTEDRAGVIAAVNWEGIISNVHVSGVVSVQYPDEGPNIWSTGGFVGRNSHLIEDSSFSGQVTGIYNVGGIAGMNDGTIRNSSSIGVVHGKQGIGGLVGVQLDASITEGNWTSAIVSGLDYFGSQIGLLCPGSSYSDCIFSK